MHLLWTSGVVFFVVGLMLLRLWFVVESESLSPLVLFPLLNPYTTSYMALVTSLALNFILVIM